MSNYQDTLSIIDREITSFRGGQTLRYRDLVAREKRDYLFDEGIRATAYSNDPDEGMPDIHHGIIQFTESALSSIAHHLLSESLTRTGDELETPKPKLFHTYGTTAMIRFTPEPDTPYTGIFQETAYGVARFSYAGPVLGVGIVPGLGLKFLIDGDHPSENAVVMRMLDPQAHHSVFENAFTNILPVPRLTNLVMRVVKTRFETVVIEGQGLHHPMHNLARVHATGTPVGGELRAPYRVIFVPTEEARRVSDPQRDFRDDLAQNLPSGATIYEILALDESQETALRAQGIGNLEALIPHGQRIGTITTESEFVASKYGDYRLFFKHSDIFMRKELL
jgi:hypothetical protein